MLHRVRKIALRDARTRHEPTAILRTFRSVSGGSHESTTETDGARRVSAKHDDPAHDRRRNVYSRILKARGAMTCATLPLLLGTRCPQRLHWPCPGLRGSSSPRFCRTSSAIATYGTVI